MKGLSITGIDVGTTKIGVVMADLYKQDILHLTCVKAFPARGLWKGVIIELEEASTAISNAVRSVEEEVGKKINSAVVGITGSHINSCNIKVNLDLPPYDNSITEEVLKKLNSLAMSAAYRQGKRILHLIPREYIINGLGKFKNPLGLKATNIILDAHLVMCGEVFYRNLERCLNEVGITIEGEQLVLEPLASSLAVLTDEERDIGVALIDIGGGTSDLAIFIQGKLCYSGAIPVGGENITYDLAVGLNTTRSEAERIKKEYGYAPLEEEDIFFRDVKGTLRKIKAKQLCAFLYPRLVEMLELIGKEIVSLGDLGQLGAGIVFTGGSSLLSGFIPLAKKLLAPLPVRLGEPVLLGEAFSPAFATGIGLVLWQKNLSFNSNSNIENLWGKVRRSFWVLVEKVYKKGGGQIGKKTGFINS